MLVLRAFDFAQGSVLSVIEGLSSVEWAQPKSEVEGPALSGVEELTTGGSTGFILRAFD